MSRLAKDRQAQFDIMVAADDKLKAGGDDPLVMAAYQAAKAKVKDYDRQIALQAKRAVPVDAYDPFNIPRRQVRRSYNLKGYKDRTDERGVVHRADEQAYCDGRLFDAILTGRPSSVEFCRERGMLTKAQNEGTGSAGAFLVPEQTETNIIRLVEEYGIFPKYAQRVPMARDLMNVPRRTGGVTATFTQEGASIVESSATWDNVQLVAKKAMVLCRISNELAEDAIVSVADYLSTEAAYAIASKIDDCGFSGDGTSTYGGIVGLKNAFVTNTAGIYQTATGHTTYDSITIKDIALWKGYLPAYALPNAKFYCSQSFYTAVFMQLAASGGGNKMADIANENINYRWLNTPIVITQKLPTLPTGSIVNTIVAYYGDLSKAAFYGAKRDISVQRSTERYFENDQTALRATCRFDVVVHDVGTTQVTGPLVALKMAAS